MIGAPPPDSPFSPRPVASLVPQAPPMLLLDTLTHYDLERGEAQTVVRPDNLFLEPSGRLAPPALVEMVAQLVASRQGYEALTHPEALTQGLLVGVQEFSFHKSAHVGDTLRIAAQQVLRVDQAVVVRGEVWREADLLGSGTLKIWELEALSPDIQKTASPSLETENPESLELFSKNTIESFGPVARAFLSCVRTWSLSETQPPVKTTGFSKATGVCRLPSTFPAFQGHFPGFPIPPAVAMLEMGRLAFQAARQQPLLLTGIKRAKFTQPIPPEKEIEFEVETLTQEEHSGMTAPADLRARVQLQIGGRSAATFLLHAQPEKENL